MLSGFALKDSRFDIGAANQCLQELMTVSFLVVALQPSAKLAMWKVLWVYNPASLNPASLGEPSQGPTLQRLASLLQSDGWLRQWT